MKKIIHLPSNASPNFKLSSKARLPYRVRYAPTFTKREIGFKNRLCRFFIMHMNYRVIAKSWYTIGC